MSIFSLSSRLTRKRYTIDPDALKTQFLSYYGAYRQSCLQLYQLGIITDPTYVTESQVESVLFEEYGTEHFTSLTGTVSVNLPALRSACFRFVGEDVFVNGVLTTEQPAVWSNWYSEFASPEPICAIYIWYYLRNELKELYSVYAKSQGIGLKKPQKMISMGFNLDYEEVYTPSTPTEGVLHTVLGRRVAFYAFDYSDLLSIFFDTNPHLLPPKGYLVHEHEKFAYSHLSGINSPHALNRNSFESFFFGNEFLADTLLSDTLAQHELEEEDIVALTKDGIFVLEEESSPLYVTFGQCALHALNGSMLSSGLAYGATGEFIPHYKMNEMYENEDFFVPIFTDIYGTSFFDREIADMILTPDYSSPAWDFVSTRTQWVKQNLVLTPEPGVSDTSLLHNPNPAVSTFYTAQNNSDLCYFGLNFLTVDDIQDLDKVRNGKVKS